MEIEQVLANSIREAVKELFQHEPEEVKLEETNADFAGDFTYVVFPLLRFSKKKPEETASAIGDYLTSKGAPLESFNVVKGFLNLVTNDTVWLQYLKDNQHNPKFGFSSNQTGSTVMVEYSSPNTNKPLHLGHVRNNLLGYSVAEIMKANGFEVVKANLINDRGIHICKSMLAWKKFGNGETPETSGIKGDHLVGKYYVEFDKHYKAEIDTLVAGGMEQEAAEKNAPLILEAQEMLRSWESGNPDTIALWQEMNSWVYSGFELTYHRLGVNFDVIYHESDTYKLGKDIITEGLNKNVFFQKPDGSVWIDLTEEGLDQKLLLRSDGTSVYMTQDLGTADLKYQQHKVQISIYVVGNEQDYHFKVLFLIMKKLGREYAAGMHHLSYGMVDLPHGKMKSREGTVVDADDLMQEMHETAKQKTLELGKTEGMQNFELNELYEKLGMAALKFYILKVDPKKRMLFNPQESIDFQGDTGPFVLYTYARIQSILKQAGESWKLEQPGDTLMAPEKEVIQVLSRMPAAVEDACKSYSPAVLCHFCLDLAKSFNRLYNELTFLKETDVQKRSLRLQLAEMTSTALKNSLQLLGIEVVERM
ncbi:MAG: arginine--tRNA ligase [Bacteroidetes bacterium]|nr:arginine--tRNA ligase [Bacteroidota bacterium]